MRLPDLPPVLGLAKSGAHRHLMPQKNRVVFDLSSDAAERR
jgi:hypothetical protein